MTEKVQISRDLLETIILHCAELVDQSLPCTMTIPAEDRETFMEFLKQQHMHYDCDGFRTHLETHWEVGEDAHFSDCAQNGDIPNS